MTEEKSPRRRLHFVLRLLAALTALVLVISAGTLGYGYHRFTRLGPLTGSKTILVPKGSNVSRIAAVLTRAEVIDNPFFFRTWVRVHGAHNRLRAGEFRFPPGISQKAVMRILIDGKMVQRRFTVAEGYTTYQVLDLVSRIRGLEGPITLQPAEGQLLPNTYFFIYGERRDVIITRMRRAMNKVLDAAWAARAPDLPIKNKYQALVLASIIEKETSKVSEMRHIAGALVNRLRRGIRLQVDPSVIYGLTNGKGPLGRRLFSKDLEINHPYNTYRIKGLPPGPIANPGKNAILAAVNPLKTKDIYFVADGTGGHVFAATLKQHNANVARWRIIRRRLERRGKR